MIVYIDKKYNFIEIFNTRNGFLFRSDNYETGNPVTQRSFPELIDIGIMGKCHISNLKICKDAGVDCYQQAANKKNGKNMSFENYCLIIDECSGSTFQVALGGSGDPNKHEHFNEILKYTRNKNIVPNLTTSGYDIADDEIESISKYCGAVAVSYYSRLVKRNNNYIETNINTLEAINKLLEANCTVNIHYVLSKDSIKDALIRLKLNLFPQKINAIIFVMYKPVGFGTENKVLDHSNENFLELLKYIDSGQSSYKIGFDTCSSPALFKYCKNTALESIDFCEAARFSMYIDNNMNAYPCSFDCEKQKYKVELKGKNVLEIWSSNEFENFRHKQETECTTCKDKAFCNSGCILDIDFNICNEKYSS